MQQPEERRLGGERRKLCRRVKPKEANPYDTRAPEERRAKNRRDSDPKTIIEEKA